MKYLTNFLRLFLLATVFFAFPFSALSVSDTVIDGIKYSLQDDGTAQVISIEDPTIIEITIPATISANQTNYTVASIADGTFDLCKNAKKVTFAEGDGVLNLGCGFSSNSYKSGIFTNCPIEEIHIGRELKYSYGPLTYSTTLKTATFGDNVKIIPEGLFTECKELTSVKLPNALTEVEGYAFRQCTKLESLSFPASVKKFGNSVFYGCLKLKKIEICDLAAWCNIDFQYGESNPLSTYASLFLNGKEVTDLVIPSTVTEIKQYAFSYCTSIRSISTGENLQTIGIGAFLSCYNAETLSIGNSVTKIGNNAFKNCSGIETVSFGENINNIGNDAFYHCSALNRVDIANLSGWCSINFSGEGNPLYHAGHLFVNGNEVADLQIPEDVKSIGDYAFYGCIGLNSISIPTSVTEIGTRAFRDCSGLTRISIGNGIKKIKTQAFLGCNALQTIEVKNTVPPTISQSTFSNNHYSSTSVLVPTGSKEAYSADQYWALFNNLSESDFSSVEQNITTPITVIASEGKITVTGTTGNNPIRIFDVNGKLVYSGHESSISMPAGFYIVTLANKQFKVMI